MIITKVVIENFKSIDKLEIPFDKVGDSYTKIFVGVNESGKSNILEALSFFDIPKQNVSYDHYCNQKLDDGKDCVIRFYMELEDGETAELRKRILSIVNTSVDFQYDIENIYKYIYLHYDSMQFLSFYIYDLKFNNQNLYINTSRNTRAGAIISIVDEEHKSDEYEELNKKNIRKVF